MEFTEQRWLAFPFRDECESVNKLGLNVGFAKGEERPTTKYPGLWGWDLTRGFEWTDPVSGMQTGDVSAPGQ